MTEQAQKLNLEKALAELQEKLVTGGDALAEKEKEQASKYRKF